MLWGVGSLRCWCHPHDCRHRSGRRRLEGTRERGSGGSYWVLKSSEKVYVWKIYQNVLSQLPILLKFFKVLLRSACKTQKLNIHCQHLPTLLIKVWMNWNLYSLLLPKKKCLLLQSGTIQLFNTLKNSYSPKGLSPYRNLCVYVCMIFYMYNINVYILISDQANIPLSLHGIFSFYHSGCQYIQE